MTKTFWKPLIKIKEIQIKINNQPYKEEEKLKLLQIVYQTIDIKVLETIFSSLPEKKHKSFLNKFAEKPSNSSILDYLKQEVEDIEERIITLIDEIKKQILQEFTD